MRADLLSSDRALLDAFRRGEQGALMAVWQHYFPLVCSIARRGFSGLGGFSSPADVEDAVSSVFVAAFEERCRLSYDGLQPYGGFLIGISRHVMRRQVRKAAREPVAEEGTGMGEELSERETPEEELLTREERAVLSGFADTLPEEERQVYLGYWRDGLSEERLAETMRRTRYRVRKALAKVERRMRFYLRRAGLE
jgi:RNA polymerase sigma factor (sigma-70 family)